MCRPCFPPWFALSLSAAVGYLVVVCCSVLPHSHSCAIAAAVSANFCFNSSCCSGWRLPSSVENWVPSVFSHFQLILLSRHHYCVLQHIQPERDCKRQVVWRQVFLSHVALLRQRRASSVAQDSQFSCSSLRARTRVASLPLKDKGHEACARVCLTPWESL